MALRVEDEPGAAPESPTPGASAAQRALTVGLLLIITLVAFEALAVATVLPIVEDDLGELRLYGWAFSGFLLASLLGITWAGEQSDRHGPARPFLAGLVLFAAGLVIGGTAPYMWVLVLGRVVQGVGAGMLPAVAWVAIGRGYDERTRPRILAYMSTAWVVPGLAGPGLAALVAHALTWRLVFLGLLPLVAVAAWLAGPGLRRLGPPAQRVEGARRMPHAFQLVLGAGLFLGGLTLSEWLFSVPLCIAGLLIAVFPLRRLLPDGALRAARGLPAAIGGHGLLNAAFFGGDAFVPFLLMTVRGEPTILVGILLSVPAITWTGGTWIVDRFTTRIDRRVFMAAGLLCVTGEMAAMALTAIPAVPLFVAAIAWALGALGMGMAYPSFSLTIIEAAAEGEEGAVSASMKLIESLGSALGAGICGAIIAAGPAIHSQRLAAGLAFCLVAALAFATIALAARAVHQSPART
jgi:MFS family permease